MTDHPRPGALDPKLMPPTFGPIPNSTLPFGQREPVSISAAGNAALLSGFALAKVFHWVHWTGEQEGAVLGFLAALTLLAGGITRSRTVPFAAVRHLVGYKK